jgi:5-formyltetrahydrofolate cyclo-ligase
VVHDCQVVEEPLPAQPHDVVVDRIVTPTRTVDVDHPPRPPGRIRWDALKGGELKELGVVAQLEALLRPDPA